MKKLIFASIFILCFSFLAFAQSENPPCPTVIVRGPNSITNLGESMSFEVLISEKNQNIEYEWTVEPKIDFSGQGTSKIKLMTNIDLAGSNITATVKIKGLPENCKNHSVNCCHYSEPYNSRLWHQADSTKEKIIMKNLQVL